MKKKVLFILIISIFIYISSVSAITEVENYPYKSSKKINSQSEINNKISTSSNNNDEVGILINKGTINLKELNILKNGESTSSNELLYGGNSALLVYNGGALNVEEATITTYGTSSNGIYIHKGSSLNINNSNIKTAGKTSSGLVSRESTIRGNKLNIKTEDESSPAMTIFKNSDLEITESEIETTKRNSPALITEANIKLKGCNINSGLSSGITIINTGNVFLDNTTLYSCDEEQNQDNSYKNIYIYGTIESRDYITFNANDSNILTESGNTFYIKNKNVNINLKNNKINSNSSTFLKGETSTNNSNINLNLDNQEIKGNIIVDDKTILNAQIKNSSKLIGTLLGNKKGISLILDETSTLVLTGNSYISNLENAKKDNSNIFLNGYKLFVNNEEIEANKGQYNEVKEPEEVRKQPKEQKEIKNNLTISLITIIGIISIAIIIVIIITFKKINKK